MKLPTNRIATHPGAFLLEQIEEMGLTVNGLARESARPHSGGGVGNIRVGTGSGLPQNPRTQTSRPNRGFSSVGFYGRTDQILRRLRQHGWAENKKNVRGERMTLLLDTYLLLWAAGSPERLSSESQDLLGDPATELMFSTASIWVGL